MWNVHQTMSKHGSHMLICMKMQAILKGVCKSLTKDLRRFSLIKFKTECCRISGSSLPQFTKKPMNYGSATKFFIKRLLWTTKWLKTTLMCGSDGLKCFWKNSSTKTHWESWNMCFSEGKIRGRKSWELRTSMICFGQTCHYGSFTLTLRFR